MIAKFKRYFRHVFPFLETQAKSKSVFHVPRTVLLVFKCLKIYLSILMELHIKSKVCKSYCRNWNLKLRSKPYSHGLIRGWIGVVILPIKSLLLINVF